MSGALETTRTVRSLFAKQVRGNTLVGFDPHRLRMENITGTDIEDTLIDTVALLERTIEVTDKSKLNQGLVLLNNDGTEQLIKFDRSGDLAFYGRKLEEAKDRLELFRSSMVQ